MKKMSKFDKFIAGAFVILCVSLAVWCIKVYYADLHDSEMYLYNTYGLEASNVIKDNELQDKLSEEGKFVEWYYLGGNRVKVCMYDDEYYAYYYDFSGILLPAED